MKLFYLIIFLLPFNLFSQGLIVNEMSNGTSGSKEFIEFLVIGSQSQPLGTVDLTNWVFDDNNGDFEASSSTGVAGGHYRFTSHFSAIPIGSIIVVYNSSDLNLNLPSDDPFDANGDLVYVLPINSIFFERCTTNPSSTNGPSYLGCSYTSLTSQTWNAIGMRNSGDAVQIRMPDYSFYHGFCYGDITLPYPNFPNGNPSFNVRTGSGTGRNYYLDCGDWTLQSNYQSDLASNDTPGLPNTANNLGMIENIRNGVFDYSNPNDPNNCSIILSLNKIKLDSDLNGFELNLFWEDEQESDYYEIFQSKTGINFEKLDECLDKNFIINNFVNSQYFKIIGYKEDQTDLSNIIYVQGRPESVLIYPNPSEGIININQNLQFDEINFYNSLGQLLKKSYDYKIDLSDFSGLTIVEIKSGKINNYIKLLIK